MQEFIYEMARLSLNKTDMHLLLVGWLFLLLFVIGSWITMAAASACDVNKTGVKFIYAIFNVCTVLTVV